MGGVNERDNEKFSIIIANIKIFENKFLDIYL